MVWYGCTGLEYGKVGGRCNVIQERWWEGVHIYGKKVVLVHLDLRNGGLKRGEPWV